MAKGSPVSGNYSENILRKDRSMFLMAFCWRYSYLLHAMYSGIPNRQLVQRVIISFWRFVEMMNASRGMV